MDTKSPMNAYDSRGELGDIASPAPRAPAHERQMNTANETEAHCGLGFPQSTQAAKRRA